MSRSADRRNDVHQIPADKALLFSFSPLEFAFNGLANELSHAAVAHKRPYLLTNFLREPDLCRFDVQEWTPSCFNFFQNDAPKSGTALLTR